MPIKIGTCAHLSLTLQIIGRESWRAPVLQLNQCGGYCWVLPVSELPKDGVKEMWLPAIIGANSYLCVQIIIICFTELDNKINRINGKYSMILV